MLDFASQLLDTSDFPARWHCGRWTPGHGWLHILSDLAVWGAYVTIPIVLSYFFFRRRRHIPFPTLVLLFAIFIFACGTTHLLEAIIFWKPVYRLAGLIKLLTAVASWGTVAALIPITPKLLALRSPDELEREIAERQRTQAELAEKHQQLRRLAVELSAAEQRERKRIAVTLHDHFQQILVAAKFGIGQLRNQAGHTSMALVVEQVDHLLDEGIQASRTLTVELNPPVLYDRGLAAALEWQERQFREQHGLTTTLQLERGTQPLIPDVQAFLFQAVRELLFNIVKHARTKQAEVTMRRTSGYVELTVADHGVGSTLEQIRARTQSNGGFGLFSVQQRIELLGGWSRVETAPNRGFRVTLAVPVDGSASTSDGEPGSEGASPRGELLATDASLGARRIRVLIADDHRMVREGIVGLLRMHDDIEIIGQAENGRSAVELARQLRPDVIIMDVTMPIMDGIDATRSIHQEEPDIRIVGLSMHETPEVMQAMLNAGAVAYLTKGGPPEALVATLRH